MRGAGPLCSVSRTGESVAFLAYAQMSIFRCKADITPTFGATLIDVGREPIRYQNRFSQAGRWNVCRSLPVVVP